LPAVISKFIWETTLISISIHVDLIEKIQSNDVKNKVAIFDRY
jgi:hypothetical protein